MAVRATGSAASDPREAIFQLAQRLGITTCVFLALHYRSGLHARNPCRTPLVAIFL